MMSEDKRPVTVEDLLRLKRAERPAAEFWPEFERQLRAKQLSALVEKRAWWRTLPSPLALLVRHRVPVGAVAAVAFVVLAMREYRPPAGGAAHSGEIATDLVRTGDELLAVEASALAPVPAAKSAALANGPSAGVAAPEISPAAAQSVLPASLPSPALSVVEEESPASAVAYAALTVPRGVAGGELAAPAAMVAAPMREAKPATQRVVVDPLQQMAPPGESRRAMRMLTAMVAANAPQPASRVTERAASRIAEESLYEQASRFGARGDRLNVKF